MRRTIRADGCPVMISKEGREMVTVKLFGLLRLDTGIRELSADVPDVRSLYPLLIEEAGKRKPGYSLKARDLDGCFVLVNGVQKNKRTRLKDGDTVTFMSPVSGG